jgi:hypothetical protein
MDRPVQMDIEVVIPASCVEAALIAIASLRDEQIPIGNAPANLIGALADWGFEAERDFRTGDVWIEVFRGRYWRQQEQLFGALAPYAQGEADVIARDGPRWRYQFGDGLLVHADAA